MSDLHQMPLRGRELPEAPKAPVRHKVKVFSYADHARQLWAWAHACADDAALGESGLLCWDTAQRLGEAHARRCCQ